MPGPRVLDPCARHSCSRCCRELDVPLTEAEADTLESAGYARHEFAFVDDEGQLQVSKKNSACFFLGGDGRCRVHGIRPAGCRYYPWVLDEAGTKPVRDALGCPVPMEFPPPLEVGQKLKELAAVLVQESHNRKA